MTTSAQAPDEPAASEWVRADPNYAQVPRTDPYIEWALGAGKAHFFLPGRQQRWMPVLVQLNGIGPQDFADGEQFVDDGPSLSLWRASVRLSPLYRSRGRDGRETYCTAMVRPGFFEFMKRSERLRKFVARVTIGLPLDAESLPVSEMPKEAGNGQP